MIELIIAQYLIIAICVIGLVGYCLLKKDGPREVILAALLTAIWVSLSGVYSYKETNLSFYSINLFPFFAWTGGLVLLKFVSDSFKPPKIIKTIGLYWIIMLALEYIGYHLLGIQLNSSFPGFFGLEVLHIPHYAQAYYFLAGPLFLLLAYAFAKPSPAPQQHRKKL